MNLIDIILLLILIFFVVKGLIRGIILEVLTLAGMVVAYVLALRQVEWAAAFFAKLIEMPPFVATTLGFLSIFIVVIVAFRIIAVILHKIVKKTPVNTLNRGGGVFVGLLKGLLMASLVAHLIAMIPIENGEFEEERKTSRFLNPSKSVAPFLFNLIKKTIPKTKTFSDELQEGVNNAVKQAETGLIEETKKKLDNQLKDTLNQESMEEVRESLKTD
ncbi:CvpA family protein [bacterium]|nr:CvpA family protein [bacterium]